MYKNLIKEASIVAIVAVLLVGIGYFIWFSPSLMVIGVILFIIDIIGLICCLTHKSTDETAEGCGCALLAILTIILLIVNLLGDDYKIFTFGGYRHIYSDCPKRESALCEEVGPISARIWGCTKDCPECKIRKEEERQRHIIELREQKKIIALKFIDRQINTLEGLREAVLNNKEIDIYDYEFKIDVEDEIRAEAIEEYRDDNLFNRFFRP